MKETYSVLKLFVDSHEASWLTCADKNLLTKLKIANEVPDALTILSYLISDELIDE